MSRSTLDLLGVLAGVGALVCMAIEALNVRRRRKRAKQKLEELRQRMLEDLARLHKKP